MMMNCSRETGTDSLCARAGRRKKHEAQTLRWRREVERKRKELERVFIKKINKVMI